MIIANPIYDAVFKFMMEDNEIARGFLSVLLDEEIIDLELKPQETILLQEAGLPAVLRMDFMAVVKTQTGENKKVLIELQKARDLVDILRFRRYLDKQYATPDMEWSEGKHKRADAFPIITIYFLGFNLPEINAPVLKVKRAYFDVLNQKELVGVKCDMVEKLSHNAYFIQILRLHPSFQTRLERVLSVFNQDFADVSPHFLSYPFEAEDPLQKLLVRRLHYAIQSEEVKLRMDAEDFYENLLGENMREFQIKLELERQQKEAAEKALEQTNQALEEKEAENQRLKKLIEELQKGKNEF